MGKPAVRLLDMTMHGGMVTGPGCPTVLIGKMPAARMTDMHVCPMCSGPVPHVGGLDVGPVPPTVFIGKLPAATVGDMFICVGPPSQALPPGCPTVLIGNAGGGGGGGGGGAGGKVAKANVFQAKKVKKVKGMSTDGLEAKITDAGRNPKAQGSGSQEDANVLQDSNESDSKENDKKSDDEIKFTIADIVEILKAVEKEEGYEAARFFSSHLDFGKLTDMARGFISKEDTNEKNDPNQMPTRFMLLYGADDSKLKEIDEHLDKFQGEEHKINVANLRKGLKLSGYDVKESGPYDDEVYNAYVKFLNAE